EPVSAHRGHRGPEPGEDGRRRRARDAPHRPGGGERSLRAIGPAPAHHALPAGDLSYFPTITSVDLMMTVTSSPFARCSDSADSLVMPETIVCPATSSSTSAMMLPSLTDLTFALS